ncbi:MATE family efflux transporter [Paenibacillus herberti]|uniref:MATE family efflux transporter n=1 Tax=Paenibacillus herberti TaxID=1619309 RepID=A0A229NYR3_9BACL|nr:MATE family efflux transporter [Paenibacillus herberti]OXM14901.1 MATE family efflux transporter [Paenibacillus herberti]
MKNRNYSLWALSWPIFIELFLQFLLGAADTFMVSEISDDAVAVVGFSQQLFNALTVLFTVIASGAGILIAQKLGARKEEDARTISIIALKATVLIGAVLSVVLVVFPEPIARVLQMPESLLPLAGTYISIIGSSMVLAAIMSTLSAAIRNTGNTRGPMYTALGMNVVHIVLNYGFIYGAFGLPEWGLGGVALSTVVSRLLASALLFYMFIFAFERKIWWGDIKVWSRSLFAEIMRIGWPLGVYSGNWVFSQLVIFTFIGSLGAMELAARTYMNTLESFCFLIGFSIALATQIRVAHLFGAGRTREAYKDCYKGLWIGQGVVIANSLLIYFLGSQALGLFTTDPDILAICASLLGLNLLLQPGKMLNMTIGDALNAVGDTKFTMYVSTISMWGVSVGIAYYFSLSLGWGLTAIYCCMIADEYLRGIVCWLRWRSRKWALRAGSPELAVSAQGGAAAEV